MTHLDPDELALLALGEHSSDAEQAHLRDCPDCARQLVELGHAAGLGRASRAVELEAPPAIVWDRIREELALGDLGPGALPSSAAAVPPPLALPPGRHRPARRRRPRALSAVLAALGALVIGVAGGAWWQASRSDDTAAVVARADLAALPDWQGASGTAELEDADGARRLHVHLDAQSADDSYREVWLLAADASGLVGLGVLDGTDGVFAVPDDVDLAEYPLVDVSQEPFDDDPEHSGDSIVRGPLREG